MREAASRSQAQKSEARKNPSQNNPSDSDGIRQEPKTSRQDDDLAGAAASQPGNTEARNDSAPAKVNEKSAQAEQGEGILGRQKNSAQDDTKESEIRLTEGEKQKLQASLKAALQILRQNPEGSEIAAELEKTLRGTGANLTHAEELTSPRLSEAQMQRLQEIFNGLKQTAKEGFAQGNLNAGAELQEKLANVLATLEQSMRRSMHNHQVQNGTRQGMAQLQQPEIVEGFVLRSEKDDVFNTASKVDDPRFAALLNKTSDFATLRERQGQQGAQGHGAASTRFAGMNPQDQAQSLVQQARAEMAAAAGESGEAGKSNAEGQTQNQILAGTSSAPGSGAGDLIGTKNAPEVAGGKDYGNVDFSGAHKGAGAPGSSGDPGVVSLKNGATMPSARVVDQTIQHLNLHARGDSSVVTVKLHPEELGELNIRMVMEGDQLKLQIQAQNQQVREILEQNFPRLRTAMEDQGVTVEDFQVSLGDSRAEDQAGAQNNDDLSHRRELLHADSSGELDMDELDLADSVPSRVSAGGLSVHV
jgi:flagellar hook-length control protein FliK